jgi:putative membrane protein
MVLIAYVKGMLRPRRLSFGVEVVVASAWMTAIDLVIDPVAAGPLRYWQWQAAGPYYGIPWSNFAGWFVVSAVIFALLRVDATPWRDNRWAVHVGASIVVFFTIIAFSYALWLGGAAGVLLLVLHWLVIRRPGGRDMLP